MSEIRLDTPVKKILEIGKACDGCAHCCSFGSGFLADEDFAPLANFLKVTIDELKDDYLEPVTKFNTTRYRPKLLRKNNMPFGPCIFLENSACKVHEVKPLQCKTYSKPSGKGVDLNSWFNIKYFLDVNDPQSVREYAQYIKAGGRIVPSAELETLIPDKKKREAILNERRHEMDKS